MTVSFYDPFIYYVCKFINGIPCSFFLHIVEEYLCKRFVNQVNLCLIEL